MSREELDCPVRVFDLEIEEAASYFAEGVLVHNSTKLKHTRTQRFGHLRPHLPGFHRRVGLTGTPSPNGLMDLFGQLYVLDLGKRLHPYITRFRLEYFTEVAPHEWLPHPDAEERIRKRIEDICRYVDPADYLDLPPLVPSRIPIRLPPKARRDYDQLEATFMVQLEKGEVTAANAAVLSNKLRQVAGGAAYHKGEAWSPVHDAKITALLDRLEEIGHPTVVVYEFNHERERIEKVLDRERLSHAHFTGTPRKRERLADEWNRGGLDVLLCHPASAGHGVNLQHGGHHVIWFGPTWNLEHHLQMTDRVHRQGQEHPTFVSTLVVEDSIEEAVCGALESKARTQRQLLEGLRRWRRKRLA